jgi:protein-tyrosine phosphatase
MRVYWVKGNLAFGSIIKTWRDVNSLRRLGINHVINLLKNRNGKKIRRFNSLWLPFRDDKKPRPKWFYKRALKFHKRACRKKGAKLLVMCYHGRSRSASLTYFLLRSSGVTPTTAESRIRAARSNAMLPRTYRDSCERFLRKSTLALDYRGQPVNFM